MTFNQPEQDLDIFIKQTQKVVDTDRQLTFHQLTHPASSSGTSTLSIRNALSRAQRISMKCKHPNNAPQYLINRPSSSRLLLCLILDIQALPIFCLKTSQFALNIHIKLPNPKAIPATTERKIPSYLPSPGSHF